VRGAAALALAAPSAAQAACMAGTATIDITPEKGLWMAGFARRTQPAQGTALPLKAKALALRYGTARPAVLVTTDLLGLTARLTDAVAREVRKRTGIPRSQLLFSASHTHCGPVIDEQLAVAYDLSPEQWRRIRTYTAALEQRRAGLTIEEVYLRRYDALMQSVAARNGRLPAHAGCHGAGVAVRAPRGVDRRFGAYPDRAWGRAGRRLCAQVGSRISRPSALGRRVQQRRVRLSAITPHP